MKSPNISPEFTVQMRKDIGAALIKTREARNLTRNDIAEMTGFKVDTISKIEHGVFSYPIDNLLAIAIALEIDISFVLK